MPENSMPFVMPFISICTPTFNRRPFILNLIKCVDSQTYPKDKMEWIIVDDGTDKIEDLVSDHPLVSYFKFDKKLTLGKKRNVMHNKAHGSIIVYMDDDDYYPPERVSHAVETLIKIPPCYVPEAAKCIFISRIRIKWCNSDRMDPIMQLREHLHSEKSYYKSINTIMMHVWQKNGNF